MSEIAPCSIAAGASIQMRNLGKRFGDVSAVKDFTLDIEAGEFLSVLGASGSGKTTVLKMIAGLEPPSCGQIVIDGVNATQLPPEARNIGLVFQDYALFPHMTAAENVAFPLQMRHIKGHRIAAEVKQILELVGAGHLGQRKPTALSGGQQQRIALARAMVFKPKLLLLDEPLSALDKNLREQLKAEIKALHRRSGITIIYVTHDQSEALALSDRIVVMREGSILAIEQPARLYGYPTSSYLAKFVGDANLIPGEVTFVHGSTIGFKCALGSCELPAARVCVDGGIRTGDPVILVVRPEQVMVEPSEHISGLVRFDCTIDELLYNGATTAYALSMSGGPMSLVARSDQHGAAALSVGKIIKVGLRLDASTLVREDSAPMSA
jgi:putative spermidine/putrescine transport system ATP-binding protein